MEYNINGKFVDVNRKSPIENAVPSPARIEYWTSDSECKITYNKKKIDYTFNEKDVLKELAEYIDTTYSSHYTNDNNDIQSLDVWKARGTMSDSCIDTTIKYLMRYGKKDGYNRKDLLKAAHYIILALGNGRN
jgi:hypothetical protein